MPTECIIVSVTDPEICHGGRDYMACETFLSSFNSSWGPEAEIIARGYLAYFGVCL